MTLATIKSAIEALSESEKAELVAWLLAIDREGWDREIARDFSSGGRGMQLLDEVDSAIDSGEFTPLG